MPILPHHRDPTMLVASHDRHRAEVFDDLALGNPATGHRDVVDAQRQNRTVIDQARALHLEVVVPGPGS